MKHRKYIFSLIVVTTISLGGCKPPNEISKGERYRITVSSGEGAFLLDTESGVVSKITNEGLTTLPTDGVVQLKIGRFYEFENGEFVVYEGNGKFGSGDDALLKKYSGDKIAP